MTRFETTNGEQLGARFAGDNGATFHLTQNELFNLFNLGGATEIINDNCDFEIQTIDDLLKAFLEGNKASQEQMTRRFSMKTLNETLHLEERQGLDENGDIRTFFCK